MILEVRHLKAVDAIYREGTVSGAARRLNLTQSAVSHALLDLEGRLGVSLFDRDKRRMRPTQHGRRLLRTAHVVLEELRRAEGDLLQWQGAAGGRIRICTQCYTCYSWLAAIMRQFMSEHPGIELLVVPDATDSPIDALLDDSLDLAIVHERPERDDIEEVALFRDELVAVLPAEHPLADRAFLTAEDFAEEHLIVHKDPEDSVLYRWMLLPAGVQPKRVSQLRLTEAVLEAVRAGMGVTVLARWILSSRQPSEQLRVVRLTKEGLYRTWTAAYRRSRTGDAALNQLIELLRLSVQGVTHAADNSPGVLTRA